MPAQNDIWSSHTSGLNVSDAIAAYQNPAIFQKELKVIIDKYARQGSKIIEVGCELGANSFILDNRFSKTLLDINPYAIDLARQAYKSLNTEHNVEFLIGDMFNMPFDNCVFDVVFNAGVIEHFDKDDRLAAIKEYSRILKNDGIMIIAYPNSRSVPYICANKFMKWIKKWPFPDDYPLDRMQQEISSVENLEVIKSMVVSHQSIFSWWNFFKPIKYLFIILDKIFHFEGYLSVIEIKKRNNFDKS